MAHADIDVATFSLHSTRAASVPAAHRATVNSDDILKTAGLSSECCFDKYYNKPIVKASSYANYVLSVNWVIMMIFFATVIITVLFNEVCGFSSCTC